MKRWILVFVLVLLAAPAFAQEEGGFGGGGGGLFGIGDAPAGNRNAPPPDRLPSLRKIMADQGTPLVKDQETSLNKMMDDQIKKYVADLEKRFPEDVAKARAAQAPPAEGEGGGGRGGNGGGGRGGPGGGGRGGRGRGSAVPPDSPLGKEMVRLNTELQDKVVAALKPEQQVALKKYQNDQIKKAGGFPALKLNMQEAGAALTADQETQIQAVYNDEDQQRRQLARESQGQPDKAKMDALTNATMLKVAKILSADQRKVLLESMKKQQPHQ
jgi:hypothetical protein